MNPAKPKQLLLERRRSLCRAGGGRQARPDLVVGTGSYESAHHVPGSTPRLLTRSIGFSSAKNDGSGVP
jgi:hypothetical protein